MSRYLDGSARIAATISAWTTFPSTCSSADVPSAEAGDQRRSVSRLAGSAARSGSRRLLWYPSTNALNMILCSHPPRFVPGWNRPEAANAFANLP